MSDLEVLQKVFDIIMHTKYSKYLELGGSFSMVYHIGREMLLMNNIKRTTRDIDFNVYHKLTYEDVENINREILSKFQGKLIFKKINKTKEGNYSISYQYKEDDVFRFKVDFGLVLGVKVGNVINLEEFFVQKVALKSKVYDRRFKDLIDVVIVLEIYFKEVTKEEILNMMNKYKVSLNNNNAWARKDVIEGNIIQSKKFKPLDVLGGKGNEQWVIYFYNLINGLYSNKIKGKDVFKNGQWFKR